MIPKKQTPSKPKPVNPTGIGLKAASTAIKKKVPVQGEESSSKLESSEHSGSSLVLVNGTVVHSEQKSKSEKVKVDPVAKASKEKSTTSKKKLSNSEKKIVSDYTQGLRVNKAMKTIDNIMAEAVIDLTDKNLDEVVISTTPSKPVSFVKPITKPPIAKPIIEGGKVNYQSYLDQETKTVKSLPPCPYKFR